MIDYQNRSIC